MNRDADPTSHWSRGLASASVAACLMASPSLAEAAGGPNCSDDLTAKAICNGFIAAVAGGAGATVMGFRLAGEPVEDEMNFLAFGYVTGLYSLLSGAYLFLPSDSIDPSPTKRDIATGLGGTNVAIGSLTLGLATVVALRYDAYEASEQAGGRGKSPVRVAIAPGVAGLDGPAAGISVTIQH
ncbi:MAG: hypothetical protein AAF928_14980 [Myxococcota bacterium]